MSCLALVGASAAGCSRQLELYNAPDEGVAPVSGPKPPDEIPDVENTGVAGDDRLACAERPTGECLGVNDFPCDFERWVAAAAGRCQMAGDCRANGWLGARIGDEGCVVAIEMTDPEPAFVACVAEEFGSFGCTQCGPVHAVSYLGIGNAGCIVACETADDCPSGSECSSGYCDAVLR